MSKNPVAKKTETSVANYDEGVLGAAEEISVDDIEVSRLAVMSSNSQLVKDDICKQGQIVDLETHEPLGYKEEKPLEVIVLKSFKYWIQKRDDKFLGKLPATHNKEMPWNDGDITNTYHHAFLVLVAPQVSEGIEMPYEIAFRSTDLATAKKLSKMLWTMARKKEPSWNRKFLISAIPRKNDKHSWWGTDIKVGEVTTQEQRACAYNWFMQMKHSEIKIKSSDEVTAAATVGNASSMQQEDVPF